MYLCVCLDVLIALQQQAVGQVHQIRIAATCGKTGVYANECRHIVMGLKLYEELS